MNSNALERRARGVLSGGVNSPVRAFNAVGGAPVFAREAHGACLSTTRGESLVDYVMSWGAGLLGHDHPTVRRRLEAAVAGGVSPTPTTSLRRPWAGSRTHWIAVSLRKAAVVIAVSACAVPSTPRRPGAEPFMRIGVVVAEPELRIAGQGLRVSPAKAGPVGDGAGDGMRFVASGDHVKTDAGSLDEYERIRVASTNRSQFVRVNGKPYRGAIEIHARDGAVYGVNEVRLEAYLMGVVSREMGVRGAAERAALEAQAIVSRTYALKNRGRFREEGFDIRSDVSDQAYGGVAAETPAGNAAVRSTAGLVLTHAGGLISPFFHSTCGGSTAGPEEAFRTVRSTPYLRPVSDRRAGGGYYCDISPRFRWEVEWEGATLRDILRRTVPSVLGIDQGAVDRLQGVTVHRTGRSGRATEVRIVVEGGEIPVFGPDVRRVFQTPEGRSLGSTAITFRPSRAGDALQRLTASGAGWGHGVGMCQWGAIGRARAGQDARAIVTTFFRGSRIEGWY